MSVKRLSWQEKQARREQKRIDGITHSAARILREADIRYTGRVQEAWRNYEKFYVPECRKHVEKLLAQGVSSILIPRKAAKMYEEAVEVNPKRYCCWCGKTLVTNPIEKYQLCYCCQKRENRIKRQNQIDVDNWLNSMPAQERIIMQSILSRPLSDKTNSAEEILATADKKTRWSKMGKKFWSASTKERHELFKKGIVV